MEIGFTLQSIIESLSDPLYNDEKYEISNYKYECYYLNSF